MLIMKYLADKEVSVGKALRWDDNVGIRGLGDVGCSVPSVTLSGRLSCAQAPDDLKNIAISL